MDRAAPVHFYKRGAAEQWIKAGHQDDPCVSSDRFRSSDARLWLSLIAYNLGNPWRRLVLLLGVGNW